MATQAPTARSRAIATQEAAIASNVAKIEEARRAPNAIENMAGRLAMSPGNLKSTLMNTVFKGASDAEFAALIVVSNVYGLNPLTKEIFAFPGKGGIVPIVSVDGWTRIMNEHPQFDGIEFNDIVDEKGNLYAIESVIYRRDRAHAIKVTEYMDECRGNGPGWQKVPKRMLRHRALIQGARIAFGFSGIYAEGDEPEAFVQQDGGDRARPVPPTRTETLVRHDPVTGEIDEETARQLDEATDGWREGPADTDRGEPNPSTLEVVDMYRNAKTPEDIAAADKAANVLGITDEPEVIQARQEVA
jgi:phage recombination protein Bet